MSYMAAGLLPESLQICWTPIEMGRQVLFLRNIQERGGIQWSNVFTSL